MSTSIETFVINLERRVDRRLETEHELARIGWSAKFFSAVEPKSAGDFPSIGVRGCFLSHLEILKNAKAEGTERLIIVEDDIAFVPNFLKRWRSALEALESEAWSIFYAGHTLGNLTRGLSLLSPSTSVLCTHFIMINGLAIPYLIEGLETILSRPAGHPLGGPMHVDGAYSTIRLRNHGLRTYVHSPTLGYQRPSRTDIGDRKWFDRFDILQPMVNILRKRRLRRLQENLD